MAQEPTTGCVLTVFSPKTGNQRIIQFDTVVAEAHNLSAQVSQHVVQTRAPIADHVRPELTKLSLSIAISETPIKQIMDRPIHDVGYRSKIGGWTGLELTTNGQKQVSSFAVKGGQPKVFIPAMKSTVRLPIDALTFPALGGQSATAVEVTNAGYQPTTTRVGGYFLTFPTPMRRRADLLEILRQMCHGGIPFWISTTLATYPNMLLKSIRAPVEGSSSITFELEFEELNTVDVAITTVDRLPARKPAKVAAKPTVPVGKRHEPEQFTSDQSVLTSTMPGSRR